MPNGLFDDTWTSRRTPAARAAAQDVGGAAGVDLLEVVDPARVDHAGGVDDVDGAAEAGEQRVEAVGAPHVADDGLDAVRVGAARSTSAASVTRARIAAASQRAVGGEVVERARDRASRRRR